MRCLRKNKRLLWYSLYMGNSETKDENGFYTGERKTEYSIPARMYANVSAAVSNADIQIFGTDIAYNRVMVVDNPDCIIDEHTVLCIDKPYTLDTDGNMIYDYIVVRAARSLNSVSYALRKVDVK